MSNRAASNRRVQPSRWDLRAEISSRELEREFPQTTVETATTGPIPIIRWSPDGYYGFTEPNL